MENDHSSGFVVDGWTVNCEVMSDDESDSNDEFTAQDGCETLGINNLLCRNGIKLEVDDGLSDVRVKSEPDDSGEIDVKPTGVLTATDENVRENSCPDDGRTVLVKTEPDSVKIEYLVPASHSDENLHTSVGTWKTSGSDSESSERGPSVKAIVNSGSFQFLPAESACTSEEPIRLETPMLVTDTLSSLNETSLEGFETTKRRRTIKQLLRGHKEAADSESSDKRAKISSNLLHKYWCRHCQLLFNSSFALEYHKANDDTHFLSTRRQEKLKCSRCSLLSESPDDSDEHTNVTCHRCRAKFQCFLVFQLHKTSEHQLKENACEVCCLELATCRQLVSHRKLCAQEHAATLRVEKSASEEGGAKTERPMNVAEYFDECQNEELSVGITNDEMNFGKTAMDSKCGEAAGGDSVSVTPEDGEGGRGAGEELHPLSVECRCRPPKKIRRSEFECLICDQDYKTKFDLDCHKAKSKCRDFLKCDLCNLAFQGPELFKNHTGHFECMRCVKEFGCLYAVQKHVRACHGLRRNECEICHKVFFALQDHRVQKHGAWNQMWPPTVPQPQVIEIEKAKMKRKRSGLVSSLPRILPKASIGTDTASEPRVGSSGENLLKIDQFRQVFHAGDLDCTLRRGANRVNFKCSSCKQPFPDLREREYHQVNSVSCLVDKPNCGCCGLQCESVDAYIEHTTPTCLKCMAQFKCARVLNLHKSVDHNLRESQCEVCAEALSFALESDLRAHRILAHGAWGNLDGGVKLLVTLPPAPT